MYLCWSVREIISREYCGVVEDWAFFFGNNAAISSAIDFEIAIFDGEKLNDMLDGVGVEFEQLTEQHKRAASAAGVISLLLALSQHFIISLLDEWSGVPPRIPLPSVETTKNVVNHFFIFCLTLFYISVICQGLFL